MLLIPLILLLFFSGAAHGDVACECPRSFGVDLAGVGEPAARAGLLAALAQAVADDCVRHAGVQAAPYRFVVEHAKVAAAGSTVTVRLVDALRREVAAWTTHSASPGAASHQRPLTEALGESRPFIELLREFERRPARCEIDLQGREAFGAGEEAELLVTLDPDPGPGTRVVVETDRGELADAVAVEKQRRAWAFRASSPPTLRYRVPRELAERDVLRVYGSCELAPVALVPLARTPRGAKLCEVEIPLLRCGGMMQISARWIHTWDHEDGLYRYIGSHEATITGGMRAGQEAGPIALYSSGLTVAWKWKSRVEVIKPEPGCPRLYEESEGGGNYDSGIAAQFSVVEISRAGGPVAAAQMRAAGLTDFYQFALAEPPVDAAKVRGKRVNGTDAKHCHVLHPVEVPVPYPTIDVRQPKTAQPMVVKREWTSRIKSSMIGISMGDEPGAAKGVLSKQEPAQFTAVLAPPSGGAGHAYTLSFSAVESKPSATK